MMLFGERCLEIDMQYEPCYYAWFSQLSTYSCQTLEVSRRYYI